MINPEPLISVIMGVNRDEGNLHKSINSILNQTYTNLEFIIMNDGNSDEVSQIVNQINDNRIILVAKEEIGLTACLNAGIDKSKGDYIARQDAGDFSKQDRFFEQIKFLQNNPSISLCGTWVNEYSNSGTDLGLTMFPLADQEIKKDILFQNTFCHGSIIIEKKVLTILKGYRNEFIRSQDYDLWLRVIESHNVANINKVLYSRIVSRDSISFLNKKSQNEYARIARLCYDARQLNNEEPLHLINNIKKDSFKISSSRKLKSIYNFYCGRRLYTNQKMKQSRIYFLHALISHPFAVKNIIYIILTCLPNSFRLVLDRVWLRSKKKHKLKID